MAVDDNMNTFWASKFDETSDPIEFVIDLGDVQRLSSIDISWEFPAKSFGIALSQDGVHFNEAFETDANILRTSRASLGMKAARKVRISMYEASVCAAYTLSLSMTAELSEFGDRRRDACHPRLRLIRLVCILDCCAIAAESITWQVDGARHFCFPIVYLWMPGFRGIFYMESDRCLSLRIGCGRW